MASRMEKYYHGNLETSSRTQRYASLYEQLYDNAKYSNVEGITNIASSNKIDIKKIKELINEHETGNDNSFFTRKEVIIEKKPEVILEDKNYDIKELINSAKKNRHMDTKEYYINDKKNTDFLERLSKLDNTDLKLNDLTDLTSLSTMGDCELSLDLLDSLQSNDNEYIGTLDERQEETTEEIDNSFYTAGMNFSKDDFEELDGINKNIKKRNIWITILVFLALVIIISGGLFLFDFLF